MTQRKVARNVTHIQEIARRLYENTERAIAVAAMHARACYTSDIPEQFDRSIEAWGFGVVVEALFLELSVTLLRIHDPTGGVASLPTLFTKLWKPGVMQAFQLERWQNRVSRPNNVSYGSGVRSQRDRQLLLDDMECWSDQEGIEQYQSTFWSVVSAQNKYRSLRADELLSRLDKLRNEYFAHSALKPTRIAGTTYGDADELLRRTIPIVDQICLALLGTDYSFQSLHNVWTARSDNFWRFASHVADKTTSHISPVTE